MRRAAKIFAAHALTTGMDERELARVAVGVGLPWCPVSEKVRSERGTVAAFAHG